MEIGPTPVPTMEGEGPPPAGVVGAPEEEISDAEWQRVLDELSSLISGKKRSDGTRWEHAFDMMQSYLEALGLSDALPRLSVVHVAGTKGKGSTCAMVESVLRAAGYRTGLYTSPHLLDVRERIRLDGAPLGRAAFARLARGVAAGLGACARAGGGAGAKPAYFRFLTLMAFRAFLEARVDVAVLEVGLGGRLDATNCVRAPAVCGVAPLGYDHMDVLGHTLAEIAAEKAGIFKPGRPAITAAQPAEAAAVLAAVAARVGAPLAGPPRPLDAYALEGGGGPAAALRLGLAGAHQRENAALAVALAAEWEAAAGVGVAAPAGGAAAAARAAAVARGELPAAYARGLAAASWPGRGQVVRGAAGAGAPGLALFLDGAHTPESMATCAAWFADAAAEDAAAEDAAAAGEEAAGAPPAVAAEGAAGQPPRTPPHPPARVLLFNCMEERDPRALLAPLAAALARRALAFDAALFVPAESRYERVGPPPPGGGPGGSGSGSGAAAGAGSSSSSGGAPDLAWQLNLRRVWEALQPQQPARPGAAAAAPAPPALPPLPEGAARGAGGAAVLPSLRAALGWLRAAAAGAPARPGGAAAVQVLVTGSLYLVGDTLGRLAREAAAAGGGAGAGKGPA